MVFVQVLTDLTTDNKSGLVNTPLSLMYALSYYLCCTGVFYPAPDRLPLKYATQKRHRTIQMALEQQFCFLSPKMVILTGNRVKIIQNCYCFLQPVKRTTSQINEKMEIKRFFLHQKNKRMLNNFFNCMNFCCDIVYIFCNKAGNFNLIGASFCLK